MKTFRYLSCVIFFLCISTTLKAQTFTLTSNTLGGQATTKEVFNGFGCQGKNKSPQLSWKNAPKETQSFAITMYDPDAPTGSGWWHWLVFNIPANVTSLEAGAGNINLNLMPKGAIQSVTDFGIPGFGGPCPPKGDGAHRYIITVYALKISNLNLEQTTLPPLVGYNINGQSLGQASMVFYYERKQDSSTSLKKSLPPLIKQSLKCMIPNLKRAQ